MYQDAALMSVDLEIGSHINDRQDGQPKEIEAISICTEEITSRLNPRLLQLLNFKAMLKYTRRQGLEWNPQLAYHVSVQLLFNDHRISYYGTCEIPGWILHVPAPNANIPRY